jgi:hypothetical protein
MQDPSVFSVFRADRNLTNLKTLKAGGSCIRAHAIMAALARDGGVIFASARPPSIAFSLAPPTIPDVPAARIVNRRAVARWRALNVEAYAARAEVRAAVKRGDLVRPAHCQVLGCRRTRVEGHHHDHRRPLEIAWLCHRHHKALHAGRILDLAPGIDPSLAGIPGQRAHHQPALPLQPKAQPMPEPRPAAILDRCHVCGVRARIGSLTKCVACLKASVDAYRQPRPRPAKPIARKRAHATQRGRR